MQLMSESEKTTTRLPDESCLFTPEVDEGSWSNDAGSETLMEHAGRGTELKS